MAEEIKVEKKDKKKKASGPYEAVEEIQSEDSDSEGKDAAIAGDSE